MICVFSVSAFAQNNIKYSETITKSELEKHIIILTSDSLEGRETGKPGQKKEGTQAPQRQAHKHIK